MSDRYCVIGNPIGHSKSPAIHALFARQTGEDLVYEARLAPLDGFAAAVRAFAAAGGRGANVTVPFKEEAFRLCDAHSDRARLAGAVNTLSFADGRIVGDNTDGAGLVRDLVFNLKTPLAGRRVLLLGAGGAARGALGPILEREPEAVVIANRTAARAEDLALHFAEVGPVRGCGFADLTGESFDVVVNATAASLAGEVPPLPEGVFSPDALAYDMMYGKGDTAFLAHARRLGVARLADGLGMLVEQAAEAFFVWRGVRPDTLPVLAALRAA
ncbi:shikimate dehydrogenase [Azospira restricta]|uniref:Shikimate dehydrogenase (NADP(+)) n=1 Tax=Azospira restricta TaxID=404405 RepID=A0A974Y437_9RHOO|nr:shikimate dehydrogenase [Azospira restricta]QRJ64248.1 shikimate dehydrogenase [Azospira restricta]